MSRQDVHEFSTKANLFSLPLQRALHFVRSCELNGQGASPPPLEGQTPDRGETVKAPQGVDCLPSAKQQTAETPLSWVTEMLCAILWTSSRASTLDQG